MSINPAAITEDEAAAFCGLSVTTLRGKRKTGQLPDGLYTRPSPKRIVYLVWRLQRWLDLACPEKWPPFEPQRPAEAAEPAAPVVTRTRTEMKARPLRVADAQQAHASAPASPPVPPAAPPGALLDVNRVAKLLCVGKRTVWRWLEEGAFPKPMRLSNACVRWRAGDVLEFLAGLEEAEGDLTGQQ